jgi:dihydropteroate synthase
VNAQQFDDWLVQEHQLAPNIFKKPLLMGIVNTTTDSFSDGGLFLSVDKAVQHALQLVEQGADIIDVGGESTKPGALSVPLDLELARVIPVIEQLHQRTDVCISIDTYKPEVMEAAIDAGASLINDVYALRQEGALSMATQLSVPICLMHMQGMPHTMQSHPIYNNGLIQDVVSFFAERIQVCEERGIGKTRLLLDPGFGFGKQVSHNMTLLKKIDDLKQLNVPLLLGMSRKSTIGTVLNKEVSQRLVGSIALAVFAAIKGVRILRVHDVDETNQALKMIDAIYHPAGY